jgi:hypothetical protein
MEEPKMKTFEDQNVLNDSLNTVHAGDEVEVQFQRTFGFGIVIVKGIAESGDGLALGVEDEHLRYPNGDIPSNLISVRVVPPASTITGTHE